MYKIIKKTSLNPTVTYMEIEAPLVARKAEPGQFIILRVDEEGERIPLTIADYNREKGVLSWRISKSFLQRKIPQSFLMLNIDIRRATKLSSKQK